MTDVERGRIDSERVARWWLTFMVVFHRLGAMLKVLLVTVGSVLAVLFASLIISIIQFQARLIEARTQNVNVTLESLQLLQEQQDYVTTQYRTVRTQAERLAGIRPDYLAKYTATYQMVSSICAALNPARENDCNNRLLEVINNNSTQISEALEQFKPPAMDAQKQEEIKNSTTSLQRELTEGGYFELSRSYLQAQRSVLTGCQTLMQYVSDRPGVTTILLVSPELRMTIQVQCSTGGVVDQPQAGSAPAQVAAQPGPTPAEGGPAQDQGRVDVRGVNRNLLSELVFYYRFYVSLTSYMGQTFAFQSFILAPPEFIIIVLVIATGTLGSFLFHTYTMFLARDYTNYPSWAAIFLRGTLSVMCALVIFILSRTGFVAITEGAQRGETAISPFVIAFVSVAAGLLAERAMDRIRSVGERALEDRSTEVTKVETKSVEIKKVETTNAETKPATG